MLITRSFKTLSIKVFIFLSGWSLFLCGADESAEWENADGYSFRRLNILKNGKPGFSRVFTNQTAVVFTNLLSKKRFTTSQIYLNGSSLAVVDYDGDGRVNIATTQNNDSIKLYFNQTAHPSIRVILKGKTSNYLCVGTTIMLESDGVKVPKREIRIGGGYLLQDSLTQIFPTNDKEAKLHVKWHNSDSVVYSIPNNAKTIIISQTDGLQVAN